MKKFLTEDKSAKSKSFFLKDSSTVVGNKFIDFLERKYKKTKKDLRICLHKNRKSNHHDMVILQQKNNFYQPHKHKRKGETYHIIKGKMACVLFSDKGKILKIFLLRKNNIFRTPLNTYHTMLPVSTHVIYHESKTGPFLKKNDSIFPKWGKKFEDNLEIKNFKKKVFNKIK